MTSTVKDPTRTLIKDPRQKVFGQAAMAVAPDAPAWWDAARASQRRRQRPRRAFHTAKERVALRCRSRSGVVDRVHQPPGAPPRVWDVCSSGLIRLDRPEQPDRHQPAGVCLRLVSRRVDQTVREPLQGSAASLLERLGHRRRPRSDRPRIECCWCRLVQQSASHRRRPSRWWRRGCGS